MKRQCMVMVALAVAFAAFGAEWYVDPVNGLDTRDGTTSNVVSATVGPRKTLEKAMEKVRANDTLWLLPGEYNEGSMLNGRGRMYVHYENVKIKSTAGAAYTFIVGEGGTDMESTSSKVCAIVDRTGVIFEGITFRDGCGQRHDSIKDNGGGIYAPSDLGTWAIDCVFTNCCAYSGGGMYFGNALRCRFVDCYSLKRSDDGDAVAYGNNFAFCLFRNCSRWYSSTFNPSGSGNRLFYNCTFYGTSGDAKSAFLQRDASAAHTVVNSIIVGYDENGSAGMYATNSVLGSASYADAFNCVLNASVANSGLVSPTEGDLRVKEACAAANLGDAALLANFPAPTGYSLDRDLAGNVVPSSGVIPAGCFVEPRSRHLYVDCVNGDDDNDGSQGNPYKTIRTATANALGGDVIHVAPGTYGETEGSQLAASSSMVETRVVIPEDVTISGTEGAEKTFIVGAAATGGQIDNATYGTGTNAIRCVYAKKGAVLRGFTLTGGRAIGTTETFDANNDAYYSAFFSATARAATVEDCIISNNAAFRGSCYQAVVKRCRVIGNAGLRQQGNGRSSPGGYACSWYNTIIDGNFGNAVIDTPYAFENCTIGTNNTWNGSGKPQVLYCYTVPGVLVNSVILDGKYYCTGNIYCTNSLVMADQIGTYLKRENSYYTIFTNLTAAQLDSEYRPILGSFVGIDAGDAAYSSEELGDKDIYETPRVLNGVIDIGAVEYDWRSNFAEELGKRFTMTYASPTVTTNATGGLVLDGRQELPALPCVAGLVNEAGPYAFTFELTGGSAQVYVGGVLAGEASGSGEQSIRFNVSDTTSEIRFTFTPDEQNPGAVLLRKFSAARGFAISFR